MFQKLGVSSFLPVPTNVQLQQSKASRGEECGWGVLLSSRLKGLEERRKLPQWGLGWSAEPQPQTILGRLKCNFMQFHAYFSAFS